jgi:hypothetical protein
MVAERLGKIRRPALKSQIPFLILCSVISIAFTAKPFFCILV